MKLPNLADLQVVSYARGKYIDWHCHEQPIIVFMLAGYARERVGRHDAILRPFDVGVKPAGIAHTDHFWDHGVRALRIGVDESLAMELNQAGTLLQRWGCNASARQWRSFMALAVALEHGVAGPSEMADLLCDGLAAVRSESALASSPPRWLRDAREALTDEWHQGLRLSGLAQRAGVHRVYLAREFRRWYGHSVGEYVAQLRLRMAIDRIATTRAPLSDIALHAGYADQSHLTRAVTQQLGITPAAYRRMLA